MKSLEPISRASIPLQLAASTIVVGFIGMKIGEYVGGSFGGALGFLVGLVVGFFGYIAVIIKREQ
ncbi:MAG: hypothetical protein HXS48_13080 [Theionarchaea archaeon]|nr:hypothetical protein [Theionarchaea archaeon]